MPIWSAQPPLLSSIQSVARNKMRWLKEAFSNTSGWSANSSAPATFAEEEDAWSTDTK